MSNRANAGADVATLLGELIAYPTENPTGDEIALARRLAGELEARGATGVEVASVPRPGRRDGGYVFGRYGTPRLLINVHLDTVPKNTGWTRDPFTAETDGDRIYGLGTADTKGAIAAVLCALDRVTPKNVGILFSGDEELGTHCVRQFVASERIGGVERAIVCEPTARRAGVRHRGVHAQKARTRGKGGHSSGADHMPRPVVTMARVAVALDELGRAYRDRGPQDMKGLCMNVARLDGGVAFNVVPDDAELTWSVRPPPGFDQESYDREIAAILERIAGAGECSIDREVMLAHQPFACRDVAWYENLIGGHVTDFVPLDFWTEAAVLASAGVDAVVVGPGDIAQAHAADEFVTRPDLDWAVDLFTHVLGQS